MKNKYSDNSSSSSTPLSPLQTSTPTPKSPKPSLEKGALPFDLHPHPELLKELMNYVISALSSEKTKASYSKFSINSPNCSEKAQNLFTPNPPEEPGDVKKIIDEVIKTYFAKSINILDPNYFGFIPGSSQTLSSVGEFISTYMNRHVAFSQMAPCLVQMECNVIRWLAKIMGYNSASRGFLTTGGSLANLWALVTARETRIPPELLHRSMVYGTAMTHHCLHKSMRVAAIPIRNFREVPTNSDFRMNPAALESMVKEDRQRGMVPFFISAAAGTTDTGSVDPLEDIAQVAKAHRLWFHVDGAYGGLFNMTKRGANQLKGVNQADSIVVDPHKTLFMPYGLGCVLVKRGELLGRAYYAHQGPYLPEFPQSQKTTTEPWNFHLFTPELSRDFRGLRAWLPIQVYGIKKHKELLDEKLDLIDYIYKNLKQIPCIRIFSKPSLSILSFYVSQSDKLDEDNILTTNLHKYIEKNERVFLTSTVVNGRFVIRVCVLNQASKKEHIENVILEINNWIAESENKL